jgi:hypothetical protein
MVKKTGEDTLKQEYWCAHGWSLYSGLNCATSCLGKKWEHKVAREIVEGVPKCVCTHCSCFFHWKHVIEKVRPYHYYSAENRNFSKVIGKWLTVNMGGFPRQPHSQTSLHDSALTGSV